MTKHVTLAAVSLSLTLLAQCISSSVANAASQITPVLLFGAAGTSGSYGIGTLGTPVPYGGMDGGGAAYAENLLGKSLTFDSQIFTFTPPYVASGELVALPVGQDSSLTILGTAVNGNQLDQLFVVTYADGSSTTFTQSMSNINAPQNFPGETIAATYAYRLNADGSAHSGAYNVYAYTFALDQSKTVKSLALPDNYRRTVFLAANLTESSAPQVVPVDLLASLGSGGEVYAIGTLGEPVLDTGMDHGGAAYAANLLGASVTYNGMTFTFDTPYAASGSEFTSLPSGQYSSLTMLGTGINGNQVNQSFLVTYTDGSTNTFTQSMSNINTPQNYPGESIASTMAYRLNADGSAHPGSYNVYAYTFALDPTKTAKALTLPDNIYKTVFLAANLTESSAPQVTQVNLLGNVGSDGEVYAIGTLGEPVPDTGMDHGGAAYASNLLGASVTYNGMTFTFDTPYAASSSEFTALPSGQYSSLTMLGTALNGNQVNQSFIVTYTDGSTNTFTQSMSNINTPQNYPGEGIASTMAYRLNADGSAHPGSYNVYAYTFALDPTKTAKALALPDNIYKTVFLAANLTTAAGTDGHTPAKLVLH